MRKAPLILERKCLAVCGVVAEVHPSTGNVAKDAQPFARVRHMDDGTLPVKEQPVRSIGERPEDLMPPACPSWLLCFQSCPYSRPSSLPSFAPHRLSLFLGVLLSSCLASGD